MREALSNSPSTRQIVTMTRLSAVSSDGSPRGRGSATLGELALSEHTPVRALAGGGTARSSSSCVVRLSPRQPVVT